MAPSLQPSGTSSAPSSETQTSSVLPGLKRGIAVGVASSVCLILIALLAFFALRRRKQRKTQRQQGHSPDAKELPAWSEEDKTSVPPEKNWILIPPSPSEADTRAIYELDASPVPELPTKIHISGAQELDAEGGNEGVIDVNRENATTRDSLERRTVIYQFCESLPLRCRPSVALHDLESAHSP
jgi:hypothetical protein